MKLCTGLLCLLLIIIGTSSEASIEQNTLLDEEGRKIMVTGHMLVEGDEYISSDNKIYRVILIEGSTVYVNHVGNIDLEEYRMELILETPETEDRPVAIFHTHSHESYIPSDGSDSIEGDGGIFDVGEAFAQSLNDLDKEAILSRNVHCPYTDSYTRSRNTVIELLRDYQPVALFDVHRDEGPAEAYALNQDLVSILIVVGRANPQYELNENFAYQIKGHVDREHPDLIKGILKVDSTYNQDLAPRLLLLEVGNQNNTKEAAIRSIRLFSNIVYPVLYVGITAEEASISLAVFFKVLFLIFLGAVAFFRFNGLDPREILIDNQILENMKASINNIINKIKQKLSE